MPAKFDLSGPAYIFVSSDVLKVDSLPETFKSTNALNEREKQLGFCERSPEVQFDGEYEGTLSAVHGTRFGGIYTYQGAEADIDMLLTKFDWQVVSEFIFPKLGMGSPMPIGAASASGYMKVPEGGSEPVPYYHFDPDKLTVNGQQVPYVCSMRIRIASPLNNKSITFPVCLVRSVRFVDIGTVPMKLYIKFRAVRISTVQYVGEGDNRKEVLGVGPVAFEGSPLSPILPLTNVY